MCKRGDIYLADLPKIPNSNIQQGFRPVLLMSNQKALDNSPVFQYLPITSEIKKEYLPVHVVLESGDLKKVSMVLGEQIHSIDNYRLKQKIGTISEDDMFKIEMAVMCELDINVNSFFYKLKSFKKQARYVSA